MPLVAYAKPTARESPTNAQRKLLELHEWYILLKVLPTSACKSKSPLKRNSKAAAQIAQIRIWLPDHVACYKSGMAWSNGYLNSL